jgi:hypothetical protein
MGVFGQVLESDGVNVDDAMLRGERMGDVHAFTKGTVWDYVKQANRLSRNWTLLRESDKVREYLSLNGAGSNRIWSRVATHARKVSSMQPQRIEEFTLFVNTQ